jgi:MGT family glycosyltransferase
MGIGSISEGKDAHYKPETNGIASKNGHTDPCREMAHIGILCMAASGHLNPMLALSHELQERGHHISVIGVADAKQKVIDAGLAFVQVGKEAYPPGYTDQMLKRIGSLAGMTAVNATVEHFQQTVQMELAEIPDVLRALSVDALLVDQACFSGGTIAQELDIPFISVSCALLLNWESSIPPVSTGWRFDPSIVGRWRNRIGKSLFDQIAKPVTQTVVNYRENKGLWRLSSGAEAWSPILQISQQPRSFEYPRRELPDWFHFTGPLTHSKARKQIYFEWEKLNAKPMIYASLGTIQNQDLSVFKTIGKACESIDAQLVISLGGGNEAEELKELAPTVMVVSTAPQLELLERASLTITHAGLNTVLESLSQGVPMVCLPITNDQPDVAARVAWTGTGVSLPLTGLSSKRLSKAVRRVWENENYKINARQLQQEIRKSGGTSHAATLVEMAVATGKPVVRGNTAAKDV